MGKVNEEGNGKKVAVDQGLWPNEADIASLDYDWASFPLRVTHVPLPVIRLSAACD